MPKWLQIPEAETAKEAAVLILGGFLWFIVKKPVVTVLVLAFLLSGPMYIAWDYAGSYRVQVKKAKPAQAVNEEDTGGLLFFSSKAYAGKPSKPCKDSIVIHGVYYGCLDTTLHGYPVLGSDRWIVHDHETEEVYDVEFPYFREAKQKYEQRKK